MFYLCQMHIKIKMEYSCHTRTDQSSISLKEFQVVYTILRMKAYFPPNTLFSRDIKPPCYRYFHGKYSLFQPIKYITAMNYDDTSTSWTTEFSPYTICKQGVPVINLFFLNLIIVDMFHQRTTRLLSIFFNFEKLEKNNRD